MCSLIYGRYQLCADSRSTCNPGFSSHASCISCGYQPSPFVRLYLSIGINALHNGWNNGSLGHLLVVIGSEAFTNQSVVEI